MTDLNILRGVGKPTLEKLARLDIHSVEDLLLHLPLRYQDRTRIRQIADLAPGHETLVEGKIVKTSVVFRGRRMMIVQISDASGMMNLRFFNFSYAQQRTLRQGTKLRCFGEVRGGGAMLEMIHPEYNFVNVGQTAEKNPSFTPVYPLTEGLGQHILRKLADQALIWLSEPGHDFEDLLPAEAPEVFRKLSIKDALLYIHRPPPDADIDLLLEGGHLMQQRLAFEELLARSLSLQRLRLRMRRHRAPPVKAEKLFAQIEADLPFQLTGAQKRVIAEIRADIQNPEPMMRLVQGDVGSGKTLVASAAILDTVESGHQAALMAPTEILAEQHYQNLSAWLEAAGVQVSLLVSKQKVAQRRRVLRQIEQGRAQVVIGTHALFQKGVEFDQLALVVIDEQHRFGVHQRLSLKQKGSQGRARPHQLIMTATPIPRSLAMTLYGDLDYSVVDELPPGRKPVQTVIIPDDKRPSVIGRVREVCGKGHQCYWICPLVEESETLQYNTVHETQATVQKQMPEFTVGVIHGRMKLEEKEAVMRSFKGGEIHVLVATTVIEVGVDVPTANILIVENAERFGLSQLHQLRGRIGRGTEQGHCILMYQSPLSARARQRLAIMRRTRDGFEIAREDLNMRGAGEIMGTRQTGEAQFKIAGLLRDPGRIEEAKEVSVVMVERYPEQTKRLIARWLGETDRYGEV